MPFAYEIFTYFWKWWDIAIDISVASTFSPHSQESKSLLEHDVLGSSFRAQKILYMFFIAAIPLLNLGRLNCSLGTRHPERAKEQVGKCIR